MTPSLPVNLQLDLFDARDEGVPDRDSSISEPLSAMSPEDYTDDDLLATVSTAGLSNVDALCSEVVARSLMTAVPALETLWQRFIGFGPNKPHRQQLAVIDTLARLDGPRPQAALRRIVLSRTLPGSLLPVALQAAIQARLALPARFVEPLLAHDETTVRRAAFSLAVRSGVAVDRLREGLQDPSDEIRLLAAVALGLRGDAQARLPLIQELLRSPSTDVIEAVTAVWDDDVIVHLGRCGQRHPHLAGAVLEALQDIGTKRALTVAGNLQVATVN